MIPYILITIQLICIAVLVGLLLGNNDRLRVIRENIDVAQIRWREVQRLEFELMQREQFLRQEEARLAGYLSMPRPGHVESKKSYDDLIDALLRREAKPETKH
jgi:hypothetical protein